MFGLKKYNIDLTKVTFLTLGTIFNELFKTL